MLPLFHDSKYSTYACCDDKYVMRIIEILLPPGIKDKSISAQHTHRIDALQRRMDTYVDKICDPTTSIKAKEFLKSKLKTDYNELKVTIASISEQLQEAVHTLPLSNKDFDLVTELMGSPIPAVISHIYIRDIIDDDEFNDQLQSIADTDPSYDIRPLIVDWIKRVMPDQMYRFTSNGRSAQQKLGTMSPISGFDPKMYTGTNDPITGDAYGSL